MSDTSINSRTADGPLPEAPVPASWTRLCEPGGGCAGGRV